MAQIGLIIGIACAMQKQMVLETPMKRPETSDMKEPMY